MNLLEMTFSGAVFITAVAAIRATAIHHLPKKTFLILWDIALLKLLLPFTVPSIFSIHTLIDRILSASSWTETETHSTAFVLSQKTFVILQGIEQPDNPCFSIWFMVWCTGMILAAAFFVTSYLHCRTEFQAAFPVSNAYTKQWLKDHPCKRRISIRQSDRISAPLTYGIFHPVILMPKKTDWENQEQLWYIFAHEYVHIRRLDAFTKLAVALALCVHWFNPFVWVMYLLFNRDMELACDESVIRRFGETAKSAYSRMLIGMEAEKSRLPSFSSHFNKNAIEERIIAIMNTKRITPAALLSACLVILVTVSLFATSAFAAHRPDDLPAAGNPQTDAENIPENKNSSMSIVHENAEILYYEDGSPYIHDVLTNYTDKTITETQYCMLAYDENGSPLKLYWNFLDSSADSSFAQIVQSEEYLLPSQTEEYRGGWSLYDSETMKHFSKTEREENRQASYVLFCLKQVVFEDGTIWHNPNYEDWFKTYAENTTSPDELQNYYPYEYEIPFH